MYPIRPVSQQAVLPVAGTLPAQGTPALAAMVAEVEDKWPHILGEKAEYVIDASGQKGEVHRQSPSSCACQQHACKQPAACLARLFTN